LNLLKAGHEVRAFDRDPAAARRVEAAGGTAAADLTAAVDGVEAVVTMLPAGAQVRAVYGDGIVPAVARDTLLIDCSTIDVDSARAVAELAAGRGLAMVDAPVSGGVGGAAAGTLTFMVGGPEAALGRARPLLAAMGERIVPTGGAGSGQAAKICNNLILGISMTAVAEAFTLADKLGLERQKLFDVAAVSSGQCWSLTTYCPVPGPVPSSPANRDYEPGFTAEMMLKDLHLALAAGQPRGVVSPLGAVAAQIYQLLHNQGLGKKDFSVIIQMLEGMHAGAR
ncbi:MAG: 3-hydroxyisobutyrate dehydrogenase, partial [Alphaproteobacteria bacterium]|nr:3-hydroxyisobutyrate dehydrogenase [Alphaproteobacteria bacterium]